MLSLRPWYISESAKKTSTIDMLKERKINYEFYETHAWSGPFANYFQEYDILTQYDMPDTSEQNGMAKRRNLTLMDMIRSTTSQSKLPKWLCGDALKSGVYFW